MKFIRELVVKGITKIKAIIEAIKHHFFPGEVNVIVCEDVLSDNVCKAMREAAKILKIKVAEVDKAIREALAKGITKAKDIIKFVRAKIDALVKDFTCEQVLDAGICKKIHEIAALIKVDAAKVDAFIRKLVLKGITKIKEIIAAIKHHFFPGVEGELIDLVKCEDVLSAKVCKDLRDIAAKLKVKIEKIDEITRELVKEKITKAKEIIKRVRDKLVELAKNFKCTDVLSESVCKEIKDFAAKIKVEAKKVDEIIKKIVAEGVTKVKEIIKKIIEHFFPKP